MSIPKTTASWVLNGQNAFDGLKFEKSVEIPKLGDHDCLVKIQAVSLNYRDLLIARGMYPFPVDFPVVPCSDASGVVIATGSKVSRFQTGAIVCTLFNQLHQTGSIFPEAMAKTLGGGVDGTLRQYAVFPETGLVRAPSNSTPAQSGTLSCAPLAAWNALNGLADHQVKPGDTVITQGTGGVSIAAVQFAVAAGATVIATTSSDAKGEVLKRLGVTHVINYKKDPNWSATVKKLTPKGEGAEHVIEVGGPATMQQSLDAIKLDGVITVIGFLGGFTVEKQPGLLETISHVCIVRGVLVGSREQMEDMNLFIEKHDIKSVVDEKIFAFEDAKEAYQYLSDQKHIGNVVIKVSD